MKKIIQITALGIFGLLGVFPTSMNAQSHYTRPANSSYHGSGYSAGYGHHERGAAIVGTTTAVGALIGGASARHHARGAVVGAVIGGFAGLMIEHAAHDHRYSEYR